MFSLGFFVVLFNLSDDRSALNGNARNHDQFSNELVVDPKSTLGQRVERRFNSVVNVITSVVRRKESERYL